MRYTELLEAEDRYLAMFRALYPEGIPPQLTGWVNQTKRNLKRQDRIVWFLKWFRLEILIDYAPPAMLVHDAALKAKLLKKFGGSLSAQEMRSQSAELSLNDFAHYADLSRQIAQMDRIVWDKQTPSELKSELRAVETEWQKKQDQTIRYDADDQPELFLDVGNGLAWYDLETPTCDREAKAMGHCGNAGGSYDQTILSLRRKTGNDHRPSLTFILHGDGTLGEMKGRENNKPSEKYHDAIVALLKDPRIKGITGGGYKPENNFSMNDLPDNIKADIQKQNPLMRDVHELYYYWLNEMKGSREGDGAMIRKRIISAVSDNLKSSDYRYVSFDVDDGTILLDRYKSPEDYMEMYHSYTGLARSFFTEHLPDLLERAYNLPLNKAQNIAEAAERAVFPHAFAELLPYDCDYQYSDNMEVEMSPEGEITIKMPIDDYFRMVEEGQHAQEGLDEVREDSPEIDHLVEETNDEPTRELYVYLKACEAARSARVGYQPIKWPKPHQALVEAMYEQFRSAQDENSFYADPRQIDFGF